MARRWTLKCFNNGHCFHEKRRFSQRYDGNDHGKYGKGRDFTRHYVEIECCNCEKIKNVSEAWWPYMR